MYQAVTQKFAPLNGAADGGLAAPSVNMLIHPTRSVPPPVSLTVMVPSAVYVPPADCVMLNDSSAFIL